MPLTTENYTTLTARSQAEIYEKLVEFFYFPKMFVKKLAKIFIDFLKNKYYNYYRNKEEHKKPKAKKLKKCLTEFLKGAIMKAQRKGKR